MHNGNTLFHGAREHATPGLSRRPPFLTYARHITKVDTAFFIPQEQITVRAALAARKREADEEEEVDEISFDED